MSTKLKARDGVPSLGSRHRRGKNPFRLLRFTPAASKRPTPIYNPKVVAISLWKFVSFAGQLVVVFQAVNISEVVGKIDFFLWRCKFTVLLFYFASDLHETCKRIFINSQIPFRGQKLTVLFTIIAGLAALHEWIDTRSCRDSARAHMGLYTNVGIGKQEIWWQWSALSSQKTIRPSVKSRCAKFVC